MSAIPIDAPPPAAIADDDEPEADADVIPLRFTNANKKQYRLRMVERGSDRGAAVVPPG